MDPALSGLVPADRHRGGPNSRLRIGICGVRRIHDAGDARRDSACPIRIPGIPDTWGHQVCDSARRAPAAVVSQLLGLLGTHTRQGSPLDQA